jgi:hypothetical protein
MHLRALLTAPLLFLAACASRGPLPAQAPPPDVAQGEGSASNSPPPSGPPRAAGPFGTSHPTVFQVAAPDGRWVFACQAREDTNGDGKVEVRYGLHGDSYGDELEPYLFLEPGAGEHIDDLVTSDERGRWLVVSRAGSLRLIDTHSRTETELALAEPRGGEEEEDPRWLPPRASLSWDGRRVLFVRGKGQEATAVVRDLEDGSEKTVEHGPGVLGSARLDPKGEWVTFEVLTKDTDGDGRLTWPRPQTSLAPPRCRGPITSYGHYGWSGDFPTRRMRRVQGGPLLEEEDVLRPMGSLLLRRGEQGELFVESSEGQRTEWVPATCRGVILHVDAPREQLLVACTAKGGPAPLELHGAAVHQSLGLHVEPPEEDNLSARPTQLVEVSAPPPQEQQAAPPARSRYLVDLERRTVHPVAEGEVEHTVGARALLVQYVQGSEDERRRQLWLLDVASGEKTLLGELEGYGLELAGNIIYHSGLLIDMGAGRLLGRIEGEVLAIDTQGRILRPKSWQERGAPLGPLRWEVSAPERHRGREAPRGP